jgi:hypothetical protein
MLYGLDALNSFDRAPTFSRDKLGASRLVAFDDDNDYLVAARREAEKREPNGPTTKAVDRALRRYAVRKKIARIFPTDEWRRKFKRFKRQWRYRKAAGE